MGVGRRPDGEAVRIGKLGRLRQARGKNDLASNIRNEPGNKSIVLAPYPANRSWRKASWQTVSTICLQGAEWQRVYHSKVLQDKGIIDKGIIRSKVLQEKGIVWNEKSSNT